MQRIMSLMCCRLAVDSVLTQWPLLTLFPRRQFVLPNLVRNDIYISLRNSLVRVRSTDERFVHILTQIMCTRLRQPASRNTTLIFQLNFSFGRVHIQI